MATSTAISTPSGFHIGKVTLTVRDLARVAEFYRSAIGLQTVHADASVEQLGSGDRLLLELRRDPHARLSTGRETGLFHTAFLLPTRADLGAWLSHAIKAHLPITGVADHLVSEAVYLSDPEGNGIEVYADRPREQWQWRDGSVVMSTDPLDVRGVVDSAEGCVWQGMPEHGIVGHVHLQVGSLPEAQQFYAGVLGMDITCRYPGALFYSAEGYHHHIATNIWNSRGAGLRTKGTTGLVSVEVLTSSSAHFDGIQGRVSELGGTFVSPGAATESAEKTLVDPWGTGIVISV